MRGLEEISECIYSSDWGDFFFWWWSRCWMDWDVVCVCYVVCSVGSGVERVCNKVREGFKSVVVRIVCGER